MGEAAEFEAEPSIDELADLMEVVLGICQVKGWKSGELEQVRLRKHEERGGFEKERILKRVSYR
ncbi:MAG: hypothetical protein CME21_18315 [Gemmatimonadetes bacterium]|nr:hypothetical protein [Gemmatimonadota bacterium]